MQGGRTRKKKQGKGGGRRTKEVKGRIRKTRNRMEKENKLEGIARKTAKQQKQGQGNETMLGNDARTISLKSSQN